MGSEAVLDEAATKRVLERQVPPMSREECNVGEEAGNYRR